MSWNDTPYRLAVTYKHFGQGAASIFRI